MPEYLSKEEIKQWRSSLEKITLEEYAARLGKVIEEEKHTNDLIDIVMHGSSSMMSKAEDSTITRSEKISSIAQRTFDREKEILSASDKKVKKSVKESKPVANIKEKAKEPVVKNSLRDDVRIVFSKALTDREQMVFEHFLKNKNQIVYAKDLAKLLDLPRDYVYKYIKNLRAKIDGESLQNADNGGYILSV